MAFTFTVLDPKEIRCLGCVYFSPLKPEAEELRAEAMYPVWAAFWVRESEVASELDRHLLSTILDWLRGEWAFDRVVFMISHKDWRQLDLLDDVGFERGKFLTLTDGRECWTFSRSLRQPESAY